MTEPLDSLRFDDANANTHRQRGMAALEASLQRLGLGRSILVDRDNRIIAGNATAEKAGETGVAQRVVYVDTDGTELIAVRRTDLSLDDPKARELAIADNRVGELNLSWDHDVLTALADEVDLDGYFTDEELNRLIPADDADDGEGEGSGTGDNTIECPHCHRTFSLPAEGG